jgi:hypothetical protein
MSATESLLKYLNSGKQVTAKAARSMFKVKHVADVVYRLRNKGHAIYTNKVTLSNGTETFAYRLGKPSASFIRDFDKDIQTARQSLYKNMFG